MAVEHRKYYESGTLGWDGGRVREGGPSCHGSPGLHRCTSGKCLLKILQFGSCSWQKQFIVTLTYFSPVKQDQCYDDLDLSRNIGGGVRNVVLTPTSSIAVS